MTTQTGTLKVIKSDAEWRQQLTPEQYRITRQHGTERAGTGPYQDDKRPGVYRCVCCNGALFDAQTKFESGTGWPSFYAPVVADAVVEIKDRSCSCVEPKSAARAAMPISDMSFQTDPPRQARATA